MQSAEAHLERALARLRASPEWKETPPTESGCRRFVRREAWRVNDDELYRQKVSGLILDTRHDDRRASGKMEILVRTSDPIGLSDLSVWNQLQDQPIKVAASDSQRICVKVHQFKNDDQFRSCLLVNRDSMAVFIAESSRIKERRLTRTWSDELGDLLAAEAPIRLREFEELIEKTSTSGEAATISIIECPKLRGYYDAYGFVNAPEEGILSVRVFDLDLQQYIDERKYRDTYEVVGCERADKSKSYWNCYVKVPCQVGKEMKKRRNVRVELHFRPVREGAAETKLAELELLNTTGWRF
ncbi:MAG TPA: hypothetical protein P5081_14990 [Phycisphaerae bacterium]|nr:hypothetical protein [Phycisphaerae bacterium]HRW54175.1 hypothetical protein [Phycisphaerae bacterium]